MNETKRKGIKQDSLNESFAEMMDGLFESGKLMKGGI